MSVHSPVHRTAIIHQSSPAILTAFRLSTVVDREGKVVDLEIPLLVLVAPYAQSSVDRTAILQAFWQPVCRLSSDRLVESSAARW